MSDVHAVLQNAQLVVFFLAAFAGLRLWLRQRSQPAAYLAGAFGTLASVLLVSRLTSALMDGPPTVVRSLTVAGLAAFPWLFARFAWSFERRTPPWLLAAGGLVAGLAIWGLVDPLPAAGEPRTSAESVFVAVFLVVWSALSIAAAAKLWRSGGSQRLVCARMRLMSVGAVLLAGTLLLAGTTTRGETSPLEVAVQGLAIGSALLFLAGFAPPRPLRMWWRRRATANWQHMQLELIAAVTPDEVAAAAVPTIADVLGSGVAVIGPDGRILASAGLNDEQVQALAARAAAGGPVPADEQWLDVADSQLVVSVSPYTPLFGQDERDLLSGFALQLRLALERAQFFRASEQARQELERSQDETQSMMIGLAHDLRTPIVSIHGYLSLLRGTDEADEREMMLDRVDAGAEHIRTLVDSLVELSRVGRTQSEREPVDLDHILDKVAGRLAGIYPGATVVSHSLPTVTANPLAMEQLFENLLANAAKHGGRDDITIRVSSRLERVTAVIEVVDDGRGIPADERESVFAPFRRGRHAGGSGSGVGLGMVRRIVDSHGGTIGLNGSSAGAHFVIELPTSKVPERTTT